MKKFFVVILVLLAGYGVYKFVEYKAFLEAMVKGEKSYTSFAQEAGLTSTEFGVSYDCHQWLTKKSNFVDYMRHTKGRGNDDLHNYAVAIPFSPEQSSIINDQSMPQTIFLMNGNSISSLSFRDKKLYLVDDKSASLSLVPDTEKESEELSKNPTSLMALFGKYMNPSWAVHNANDSATFMYSDKSLMLVCNKEKCMLFQNGMKIAPENIAPHINSLSKDHPVFQSAFVCDQIQLEPELKAIKSKSDLLTFCLPEGFAAPLKDGVVANYERAVKSCQSFKTDILPVMNSYLSQP